MKRKIFLLIFVIFALLVALQIQCAPAGWNDIRVGAVEALIQVYSSGIKVASDDLDRIDNNLLDVQSKIVKLDEVLIPAQNWTESKKNLEHKVIGWVKQQVTSEGLDTLKNDQYKITKLELLAVQNSTNTGWVFTSTIKVNDLETGETYNSNDLKDNLATLKSSLEQQRKAKLDSMNLAKSTITSVAESVRGWVVQRVGNMYTFSGPGLGWADSKLTTGQWSYQAATKEIAPADSASQALKTVLIASQ
jgi:hypothetical protein